MKVSELLNSPEKWTQGTSARDANKNPCSYSNHPDACCWCLLGAVIRCYRKSEDIAGVNIKLGRSIETLFPNRYRSGSTISFNDHPLTTFEDVAKVVQHADV